MLASCVLEVNLINCSDKQRDNGEMYSLVSRFTAPVIVHTCTPEHLYIFTYPKYRPSDLDQEVKDPSNWLYKDRDTLINIPRKHVTCLGKELKEQYNALVQRKPVLLFDASDGKFQPCIQKKHLSVTIRPCDTLVSLKETKEGKPVKTNKNRSPGLSSKYQETILNKGFLQFSSTSSFHYDPARYIVPAHECTDGPTDNVVFHITPSIQENISENIFTGEASLPGRPANVGNHGSSTSHGAPGPASRARLPCRHPDYQDQQDRLESFRTWPLLVGVQNDEDRTVQNVENLAACGFFYTGRFDFVRCYQCGLGMKDWGYSDDPLIEHVRFSPNCLHLAETVDPARLQQLQNLNSSDRATVNRASHTLAGPRLRHPEYQAREIRVKSYRSWPRDLVQTPELLSEAGFYYTGFQDQVRCYACDGGLQHWDTEDDPWIEHARWFPHCVHMRHVKGEVFINMVQLTLARSDEEEDSGADILSMDLANATFNGASGGGRESEDLTYHPAAQSAITNFGFSKAAVRMAIQECTDKGVRWNQEVLANLLLDKQENGEVLPVDSPRSESPVQEIDTSTDEGVMAEYKRLRNRIKCILCDKKNADVLFLPCAHHKMCGQCADDVTMCPVCGKQVKEKVKTFMA